MYSILLIYLYSGFETRTALIIGLMRTHIYGHGLEEKVFPPSSDGLDPIDVILSALAIENIIIQILGS